MVLAIISLFGLYLVAVILGGVVPQLWLFMDACRARSSTWADVLPRTKRAIGLDPYDFKIMFEACVDERFDKIESLLITRGF